MSRQFKILLFSFMVTANCPYVMGAAGDELLKPIEYKKVIALSEDEIEQEKIAAEMRCICQSAPWRAQNIIEHLKNPSYLEDGKKRFAILYGAPGTGKTTYAEAVAYIMQHEEGWETNIFSSSDFLGAQRNQGALKLKSTLDEIVKRKTPNIVVINELNQLLENAQSSHHDTDATSKTLWEFLDKQNNNDRFFLIGTMNRIDALPQQLKSRWFYHCIEFTAADLTHKNKIFRESFNGSAFTLSDDIDDTFLTEQLHHIYDSTYRSLQGFAALVKELCRYHSKGSQELVITKLDIEQAVKDYQAMFKALKYDVVEETDAQRQERHFVQQQLMNLAIHSRQVTNYSYIPGSFAMDKTCQTLEPEDTAEIRGLFTSEQKILVDDALARAARARQAELDRIAQATSASAARNDGCAVQ